MLRLVQACGAPELLDALASDLALTRHELGPLEPLTLAVDGPAIGAMVRQGLALRLGIAANLHIRPLRSLIAEAVGVHYPLITPDRVSAGLVELLHDETLLALPELSPVRRYLDAPSPDARDTRRVQLAALMARCFDAYVMHRPDWVDAWRAGRTVTEGRDESWQRELFRRLLPAPETEDAPRLLSDAVRDPRPWTPLPALFAFEVPLRGPTMAKAMTRLVQDTPTRAYVRVPSLEPWEARDGSWMLRHWGRAAQIESRSWLELSQWDAELHPPAEPTEDHLLARLRTDTSLQSPPEPASDEDRSVEIIAAPGLRRACEAVAEEAWRLLEVHPELRWSDIVVALAADDDGAQRSQLAIAFAEAGNIPFHELEVPLASRSPLLDAMFQLLALPGSAFTRQDVLRILTHPAVRARHGIGDTDDWVAWCERLSIVHGRDHADHAGTYIEKDLFNWDQGLSRLALGFFVAGEGLGRDDLEPIPQAGLPLEVQARELSSAAGLVALARSLIADARLAAELRLPLAEWSAFMRAYLESYLEAGTDEERRIFDRALEHADALSAHAGTAELSWTTASSLLEDRLRSLRGPRGATLAESVLIAPLAAVASVPFEVAFVMGLEEGSFPSADRGSALDLRRVSPRPDDVGPRALDEHALLLRVLCTHTALRLCRIARDPVTGDEIAPSSAVLQLLRGVQTDYGRAPGSLNRQPPLRRYEDPGHSAGARLERDAVELGRTVSRALGDARRHLDLFELEGITEPPTWRALARRLKAFLPESAPEGGGGPKRVSLGNLRRFLEDPLQGWARQALGLSSSDLRADPFARTHEHFELEAKDATPLLRSVFLEWVDAPEERLEHLYRGHADRLELEGRLPTGVFGDAVRRRHLDTLDSWRMRLLEATEGRVVPLERLDLGQGRPGRGRARVLPALELTGASLVGSTEALLPGTGSVVLVDREVKGARAAVREDLRGWLSMLVAIANAETAPAGWVAFTAGREGRLRRSSFVVPTPAEARGRLDGLVEELLGTPHPYLLPLETQLKLLEARTSGKSERHLRTVLEAATPDGFGPLEVSAELKPPSLDEALEMIDRRLGPFVEARGGLR